MIQTVEERRAACREGAWTYVCCWRDLKQLTAAKASEALEDIDFSIYEGFWPTLAEACVALRRDMDRIDRAGWGGWDREREYAMLALMERVAREA